MVRRVRHAVTGSQLSDRARRALTRFASLQSLKLCDDLPYLGVGIAVAALKFRREMLQVVQMSDHGLLPSQIDTGGSIAQFTYRASLKLAQLVCLGEGPCQATPAGAGHSARVVGKSQMRFKAK
jgi:hypothetical protein